MDPMQDEETRRPTDRPDRLPPDELDFWRDGPGLVASVLRASVTDRISVAASGSAFWATLSLFPAISTIVFLYGLVFDRDSVEAQLQVVQSLLPAPAFALIGSRIHQLVLQPSGSLSAGLLVSVLVGFWSAASGTKSVFSALNIVFGVEERRNFVRFQFAGLLMTLCALLAAVLAIAVLVALPVAIASLGVHAHSAGWLHLASFSGLLGLVGGSIALLYRFGPSRDPSPGQRIAPGAVLATLLWLAASVALSFYVSNLSTFSVTYGPLGAVVGVMLWFWVSAYAVLLGAELNARLERGQHRSW